MTGRMTNQDTTLITEHVTQRGTKIGPSINFVTGLSDSTDRTGDNDGRDGNSTEGVTDGTVVGSTSPLLAGLSGENDEKEDGR